MATVTNLAEIRKERLCVLTDMLAHARIFVPRDLASDTEWRSKAHSAVETAANESGLAAEVRDLRKEVLADVEIVEDAPCRRRPRLQSRQARLRRELRWDNPTRQYRV